MRSYALLISNLRVTRNFSVWSWYGCHNIIKSRSFGNKVDWLSNMYLLRASFNQFARTLATTLYNTLHDAIGRQFHIDSCVSPFEMRVMLVALRLGGNTPCEEHRA